MSKEVEGLGPGGQGEEREFLEVNLFLGCKSKGINSDSGKVKVTFNRSINEFSVGET